jgi:hypothetical protein
MESAETTEPLSLVHPRAAQVSVLATDAGLDVTNITSGTLHLRLRPTRRTFLSTSLNVDGSFVTVSVPSASGLEHLKDALTAAVPEGYFVLSHPSDEALIVTIARAWDQAPAPNIFCTSYDTSLRARKLGANRLLLKGTAKGRGDVAFKLNDRELRIRPLRGETPIELAIRVRALLATTHITLLTVPSTPDGEVVLTVLPRR